MGDPLLRSAIVCDLTLPADDKGVKRPSYSVSSGANSLSKGISILSLARRCEHDIDGEECSTRAVVCSVSKVGSAYATSVGVRPAFPVWQTAVVLRFLFSFAELKAPEVSPSDFTTGV